MSNVAITEWGEERSGLNEEQVILILMIIDIDTAILVVVAILVAHSRCRQAPDYNVCVDNSPCLNHCLFFLLKISPGQFNMTPYNNISSTTDLPFSLRGITDPKL